MYSPSRSAKSAPEVALRLILILPAALAAPGCAGEPVAPEYDCLRQDLGHVPAFELTDQLGRTVRREDLLGKVWIANFFFSHCAGDCSKTNAVMAQLQRTLADLPAVRLVGFSVDPEDDTPAVLRAYGERWGNDPSRWLLLTGPEKTMHGLIQRGFKQAVQRNPESKPGYEVIHTFALVVVDDRGQIRGYTDGREESAAGRVEERVRELRLAADPGRSALRTVLPAVNAALNGLCGILLVLGFVAVRRRRLWLHQVLMLIALGVSAAFLASYLYYHLAVLRGQPTRFQGQGWWRPLYFAVLISHTVLAALVTPLALVVAWRGLAGQLGRHVRLARWVFPLWLYVSVTGVLVYGMLYHLHPAE